MSDRTFKDIKNDLIESSIDFCRNMIESDKNNIERCREEIEFYEKFLAEEAVSDKSYYEERLTRLKESSKNYEILLKDKESKLARWQIQKFRINNDRFKVIKGGADHDQ
jgi:hypothetical protein